MSDFKPIESQEEFNAMVAERIERAKATAQKEVAEIQARYDDLSKQVADLTAQISAKDEALGTNAKTVEELTAKVQSYETASVKTKIALETGIPYELADRLAGTTEDEIREDAKRFASFTKPKEVAPIGSPEPIREGDARKSAFLDLAQTLIEKE